MANYVNEFKNEKIENNEYKSTLNHRRSTLNLEEDLAEFKKAQIN